MGALRRIFVSTAKPTHQIYGLLVRYPHLISRGRIIPNRGPLP